MVNISKVTFGYANFIASRTNLKNVSLGDFTYIAKNSGISHAQIGKFCSIGDNVKIGLAYHPVNLVSTHPSFYLKYKKLPFFAETSLFDVYKTVHIGNDVWIGTNSIVMGGIVIGNGAIVAAGSIVTKDVEPYSIVGGNPAKIIKYRFDDKTIAALNKIEWWNKDTTWIKHNYKKFLDLSTFLSEFNNIKD
jgi:acetyltransferase-like isoleucine patch superfamily enzyme